MHDEHEVTPPTDQVLPEDSSTPYTTIHKVAIAKQESAPGMKVSTKLFMATVIILCFIVGLVIASQANKPTPKTHLSQSSSSSASSSESQYTKTQSDNNDVLNSTTESNGQVKDEGNYCSNIVNALTAC